MRCLSCNCELTDFEATRKFKLSEEFVDLCNSCFNKAEFNDDDFITNSLFEEQLNEQEYNEEY